MTLCGGRDVKIQELSIPRRKEKRERERMFGLVLLNVHRGEMAY